MTAIIRTLQTLYTYYIITPKTFTPQIELSEIHFCVQMLYNLLIRLMNHDHTPCLPKNSHLNRNPIDEIITTIVTKQTS